MLKQGSVVSLVSSLVVASALGCGGQGPSGSSQASTSAAVNLPWQTGIRATGNGATIEPGVNDTDGSQIFMITPNGAPFYDGSTTPDAPLPHPFDKVSAPLYLVTYPMASTVDSGSAPPLNCYTEGAFTGGTYNCDHALIPGIKGHDHLVGVPGSAKAGGDFDVPWHVLATFFTPQGIADGAMNTRILTLEQLQAAQAAGDVSGFVDTHIYFMCSVTSGAVYAHSTPLSFP